MVRAIREGYRVLRAHAVPIVPPSHRLFQWLPEPLLLLVMRRMLRSEDARVKIGHALRARGEMQMLADEFRVLTDSAAVQTPALRRLLESLDPSAEPLADGAAELPVRWGAVWGLLGGLAVLVALLSRL